MNISRIAAIVEYAGTNYRGWQSQQNLPHQTIQAELERAISRVADHAVNITAAGRTDAGVHATAQVIHFDTSAIRAPYAWLSGINSNLLPDIAIKKIITDMPQDFHARYSATARRYQYLILNSRVRSAIMHHRGTVIYENLNAENMHKAAQYFLGEQDFSALRATSCQSKTPVRTVCFCNVSRSGSWIIIDVQANAFLHHMVRNMTGVLLAIGKGEKPVHWAKEVMESRDRTRAGITAPPEGLYLVKVIYPEKFAEINNL